MAGRRLAKGLRPQSHPKATLKPPTCDLHATLKPPSCDLHATFMRPSCDPQATPKPGQSNFFKDLAGAFLRHRASGYARRLMRKHGIATAARGRPGVTTR